MRARRERRGQLRPWLHYSWRLFRRLRNCILRLFHHLLRWHSWQLVLWAGLLRCRLHLCHGGLHSCSVATTVVVLLCYSQELAAASSLHLVLLGHRRVRRRLWRMILHHGHRGHHRRQRGPRHSERRHPRRRRRLAPATLHCQQGGLPPLGVESFQLSHRLGQVPLKILELGGVLGQELSGAGGLCLHRRTLTQDGLQLGQQRVGYHRHLGQLHPVFFMLPMTIFGLQIGRVRLEVHR
mmetsp:Transcript_122480/g.280727  ORF Transcript_122480/g.280727 Transcript_122480/m.280727 type:complete len:238 (-) Transcript_122480:544-1257(-)